MSPIHYSIYPASPGAHLFEVTLTIQEPDPVGQVIAMPNWIPGSYLVRDFARHVVSIRAESDGEAVNIDKLDKSSWIAAPTDSALVIVAEIYAYDLSVRGAHLDTTHAYFNGTCVFFQVVGSEELHCEVEILPPPDNIGSDWRVATSLQSEDAGQYEFGTYQANNYDELIDQPVEIGSLTIGEFEVQGIPHAIAIYGRSKLDMGRLCKDLTTLCSTHIELLGVPDDLDRYVFLLTVTGDGYGGLEHRWSSSLVCSRKDLPRRGDDSVSDNYRTFLGLCSHEYFHLWNVKRMKPAVFTPYDLTAESYTRLLWVFEGITSYYDDLALIRSDLIGTESYLQLLGRTITRVLRGRGRFRQSIADSSFDAWTKFYKQDANSTNSIVSYYAKGSLVALALDLTLRTQSKNNCSLDVVMRECWKRYGKVGNGMPENGLESVAEEVSGLDLSAFFEKYVHGTVDLSLGPLLAEMGIQYHARPTQSSRDKGGKRGSSKRAPVSWIGADLISRNGASIFKAVHTGSPAEQAGLATGDIAVALDQLKLNSANISDRLLDYYPGDKATLTVFRGDELMRIPVTMASPPADSCYLIINDDCSEEAEARQSAWLKGQ